MACGLPVLCSDRGALPEITADAARRVDPTDTAALAAAARELLEHPEQRTGLAARGRRRAARYTWERTAAATEACYREIAIP
jgi:glycosyltransferase involved in cell wall biosynthesis